MEHTILQEGVPFYQGNRINHFGLSRVSSLWKTPPSIYPRASPEEHAAALYEERLNPRLLLGTYVPASDMGSGKLEWLWTR